MWTCLTLRHGTQDDDVRIASVLAVLRFRIVYMILCLPSLCSLFLSAVPFHTTMSTGNLYLSYISLGNVLLIFFSCLLLEVYFMRHVIPCRSVYVSPRDSLRSLLLFNIVTIIPLFFTNDFVQPIIGD